MKKTILVPLVLFAGIVYFGGCSQNPKSEEEVESVTLSPEDFQEIGIKYANSTQAELGKNLMAAINKDGTLGALEFCNVQAYPLTDSMAVVHNAQIKRVTDMPRNPLNMANAEELGYIEKYKKDLATGAKIEPIVKERDGKLYFYSSILTNPMCMQCHGEPQEQVKPETMAKLNELYPTDQAIGYSENQIRGMWAVVFDKKTVE